MQGEENVTPGLPSHTRWDASLNPHPSGPTRLTREENAGAWEVWSQGQPPAAGAGSRSGHGSGWGTSESSRPPPYGVRLRGRLSSDSGPAVPPLGWDTLSGKDGPAPAFPPAWTHLAFTEPDQRIGCWEGCFIMMMILNKIISWYVAYTQKEEKS